MGLQCSASDSLRGDVPCSYIIYNRPMRCRLHLTAAASLLLIAACSRHKATQSASESVQGPVAYSSNGWSNAERAEYYHLAEGSELMPYKVLANIVSIKTGRPFLEQMERFGFIPDAPGPTNPH